MTDQLSTDTIQCPECGSFAWYADYETGHLACDDCGNQWGVLDEDDAKYPPLLPWNGQPLDVVQYELEVEANRDGSGLASLYRVDETGRYFENAQEISAEDYMTLKNAAPGGSVDPTLDNDDYECQS